MFAFSELYLDILTRFGLNILAMLLLIFVLYYPRYRQKETAIAAALFNVFAFAVLSILASVQFSVAAGFGLFAILALFALRSEQINVSNIAYFFGAVSVAVISSIQGTQLEFVVLMLALVLIAVYLIDHPKILSNASQMRLILDYIPENLVSNPEGLKAELSEKLGVTVVSVRIINIDYVTETVRLEISFHTI